MIHSNAITDPQSPWGYLQRVLFRFLFIYFLLQIAPWMWLGDVPGISFLAGIYSRLMDAVIAFCNSQWFHFAKTNIVNNGSGDTSLAWEETFTYLLLAIAGGLVWGIIDRKRPSYNNLAYWLRTFLRYFLILNCLNYGIDKLFASQMPFPNYSQLATPLGDFLPMRFSWMFIGYSTPYEVFSGAMEVIAGLLLLNRKTITLGLFIGAVVFANVMMLNLCYDIPVKLFSMHLFIYCLYLLCTDGKRLFLFFIQNKAVNGSSLYQISFPKKWMRVSRIVLKIVFILLFGVVGLINNGQRYLSEKSKKDNPPFTAGVYDIISYTVNKDTLPPLLTDSLRWKDIIFEKGGIGSVASTDTSFRKRYGRGYFNFETDSASQTIRFKKLASDTFFRFTMMYQVADSNTIRLTGTRKSDSLHIVIRKSNRHFQLAERQFHWISEANR